MNDDCILCLEETRETMQLAITHLERELHKIRAGKATPDMLEGVKIEYYGTVTPLNQVSNITTPDPKQIIVQPWDRSILGVIEKAIMAANPEIDGVWAGGGEMALGAALAQEKTGDRWPNKDGLGNALAAQASDDQAERKPTASDEDDGRASGGAGPILGRDEQARDRRAQTDRLGPPEHGPGRTGHITGRGRRHDQHGGDQEYAHGLDREHHHQGQQAGKQILVRRDSYPVRLGQGRIEADVE